MIGIVLALVLRGIFIAVGAAAIAQFSWVFYIFGALPGADRGQPRPRGRRGRGRVRRAAAGPLGARRHLPFTETWNGAKLTVRENGSRLFTPMFLVDPDPRA